MYSNTTIHLAVPNIFFLTKSFKGNKKSVSWDIKKTTLKSHFLSLASSHQILKLIVRDLDDDIVGC